MATATAAPPTTPPAAKVWTVEEWLALPDDGVERWLIRGQLREQPSEFPEAGVTVRNKFHSELTVAIGSLLRVWALSQPPPRGKVYGGEVGVRLRGPGESAVGADVAYVDPARLAAQPGGSTLLVGPPALAVEILSPSDTVELVEEKVQEYLTAGTPVVWVVNPWQRAVTVYRPGREPELFNLTHRLPEDPAMPGFAPAVAELFE